MTFRMSPSASETLSPTCLVLPVPDIPNFHPPNLTSYTYQKKKYARLTHAHAFAGRCRPSVASKKAKKKACSGPDRDSTVRTLDDAHFEPIGCHLHPGPPAE